MDYDSLTRAQRRTYDATLRGTHHRIVEADLLTLDGDPVRDLGRILGGGIEGDVTRTPVEVLTVDVLDKAGRLDWAGGGHRRFLVQITDSRFVPDFDEWVDRVIFTGPLWDFDRSGIVVTLIAQGSERMAMGSVRRVFERPRKSRADRVIRALLTEAGATSRNLSIPTLRTRLPERVTIGVEVGKNPDDKNRTPRRRIFRATREDSYWREAARIARALDRDLFADPLGRFLLRSPKTRPLTRLTDSTLVAPVVERRGEAGEVTNTWFIVGANPKGPKPQVRVRVALPRRHPLSAARLSWNGEVREVSERVENRHLRTKAQARRFGQRLRDRAVRELVEYEVEALPVIPWMRPDSLVSVPVDGGRTSVRVKRWTIPLGPGPDPLVLGSNRRRGWSR